MSPCNGCDSAGFIDGEVCPVCNGTGIDENDYDEDDDF